MGVGLGVGEGVAVAVRVTAAVGDPGQGVQVGQGVVVGQGWVLLSSQAVASVATAKPRTTSQCFMGSPFACS